MRFRVRNIVFYVSLLVLYLIFHSFIQNHHKRDEDRDVEEYEIRERDVQEDDNDQARELSEQLEKIRERLLHPPKDLKDFTNVATTEAAEDPKDSADVKYKDLLKTHAEGSVTDALESLTDPVIDDPLDDLDSQLNIPRPLDNQISAIGSEPVCKLPRKRSSDLHTLDIYRNHSSYFQSTYATLPKGKPQDGPLPFLRVIAIPHSHLDPGWLKTFDRYYKTQVKYLLDLMVEKLTAHKELKFMHTELSFLNEWWMDSTTNQRAAFRKLVREGRLELSTGGWVMPDEAVTHYYDLVDQLFEGHEWLRINMAGHQPSQSWACDPFGHSSTVPYLNRLANINATYIYRIHHAVRRFLIDENKLEFNWRPQWSVDGTRDASIHLAPVNSYSVKQDCGIGQGCENLNLPKKEDRMEIKQAASHLSATFRGRASVFNSDVILVSVGDDFRFTDEKDWNALLEYYIPSLKYMNEQKEWNIHATIGTLSDYYAAKKQSQNKAKLSTFSGDFFTYSDGKDEYWSGYYTSRPFHKRAARQTRSWLRAAEQLLAFSQNTRHGHHVLTEARRNLALFQHHDAITGTSKDFVMRDYLARLVNSTQDCRMVLEDTIKQKLPNTIVHSMDDSQLSEEFISLSTISATHIIMYNSLLSHRTELVCLNVDQSDVEVSMTGSYASFPYPHQILPLVSVHENEVSINASIYKLCFLASVPPLDFTSYEVKITRNSKERKSTVKCSENVQAPGIFNSEIYEKSDFTVSNEVLNVTFDGNSGLLEGIQLRQADAPLVDAKLQFLLYQHKSNTGSVRQSGAYVFLARDSPKVASSSQNTIIVVEGALLTEVHVHVKSAHVLHTIRIAKDASSTDLYGLSVDSVIDLESFKQYGDNMGIEVAMQLLTSVKNLNMEWYSDLNGLHMTKRVATLAVPYEGNFYPMTSAAYIEGTTSRLTVASDHSLGVTSVRNGELQFMLDRKLRTDDRRGLGEGVMDCRPTRLRFTILIEQIEAAAQPVDNNMGYLSALADHFVQKLNHPLLLSRSSEPFIHVSTSKRFPCDLQLMNVRRRIDTGETLFWLHRTVHDCRVSQLATNFRMGCNDQSVSLEDFFPDIKLNTETKQLSLTGRNRIALHTRGRKLQMSEFEIQTFSVTLET